MKNMLWPSYDIAYLLAYKKGPFSDSEVITESGDTTFKNGGQHLSSGLKKMADVSK